MTDDEVGKRLKRAAWGFFLLGPLGALIGGAMKTKPTNRFSRSPLLRRNFTKLEHELLVRLEEHLHP
jgi:hypothetical protein